MAGGHSIADSGVKDGLSVTGLVDPRRIYTNDAGQVGDRLILTKALGVGLICTANRVGEAAPEQMEAAIQSMTTLNKTASEIRPPLPGPCRYGCDRVRLSGALAGDDGDRLHCVIQADRLPVLPGAWEAARTPACIRRRGSETRNHLGSRVEFRGVPFPMEESCSTLRRPAACCWQ